MTLQLPVKVLFIEPQYHAPEDGRPHEPVVHAGPAPMSPEKCIEPESHEEDPDHRLHEIGQEGVQLQQRNDKRR